DADHERFAARPRRDDAQEEPREPRARALPAVPELRRQGLRQVAGDRLLRDLPRDPAPASSVRFPGAARARAAGRHRAAARRGIGQRRRARAPDGQADPPAERGDVCAGPVRCRADVSAPTPIRRLLRALLASAAVVFIATARAIGGLRTAMTRLPSYQAELEQWVAASLGIGLDFARLDARLGLRGPEITFHQASVRAPDEAEPFFAARRAAVVLDAWALLAHRELRAKRLTFEGTDFTLLRRENGRLELEGAPRRGAAADLALWLPPELEVALRDSRVVYVDRTRGISWAFRDVALDLERSGATLELEARARPPDGLGARVELAVQGDFGQGGGWRVFGDVAAADLAELAAALPELPIRPEHGRGDAAIWLEWVEGRVTRGMLDASFADVGLAGRPERYERLGGSAEWLRAESGWRVVLNDVEIARDGRAWAPNADTVIELGLGDDGLEAVAVESTFVRIEDLSPLVAVLPPSEWTRSWLELAPRGDVADLALTAERRGDGFQYAISVRFDGAGISPSSRAPGFAGFSGELRADSASGRIAF